MNQHLKKILIVAHHYPPHIAGVGMVAHNQAKKLVSAGYDVTVITSDTSKDERSGIMDGVNVVRVKALNFTEDRLGAPFPIFFPGLITTLIRFTRDADVIHIHETFYMSSFFAAIIARFYKKPIALTQHIAMVAHPSRLIVFIQKAVYATTGAIIFSLSKTIFVYNDRVRRFLIEQKVPETKIRVLMNGVDTDLFCVANGEKNALKTKLGLDLKRKVVLFVGRLVPKKGFDKVLAAANQEYQIAFAGCEPIKHASPHVVFLGKMNHERLSEVYRASDIFVLPSESEGFPLSIQEAMASGLPIITSNDDGYASYALDARLVRLIDKPTKESVRESISATIYDEDLLKNMSAYSRDYAIANFSWPAILQKLISTYHELVTPKI